METPPTSPVVYGSRPIALCNGSGSEKDGGLNIEDRPNLTSRVPRAETLNGNDRGETRLPVFPDQNQLAVDIQILLVVGAHVLKHEWRPDFIREAIECEIHTLCVCEHIFHIVSLEVRNNVFLILLVLHHDV